MPYMLPALRAQAEARGLLAHGAKLDAAQVFRLIRDMPYERASSREPSTILAEWRGTCSGKHYLLQEIYHELGLDARLMMGLHTFADADGFPDELRGILDDGPLPDVHTFLHLTGPDGAMLVDATWPARFKGRGLAVNEDFRWGVDMQLACRPTEVVPVPEGSDPQACKDDLIRRHCAGQEERRDRFIRGLSTWLAS